MTTETRAILRRSKGRIQFDKEIFVGLLASADLQEELTRTQIADLEDARTFLDEVLTSLSTILGGKS